MITVEELSIEELRLEYVKLYNKHLNTQLSLLRETNTLSSFINLRLHMINNRLEELNNSNIIYFSFHLMESRKLLDEFKRLICMFKYMNKFAKLGGLENELGK